VYTLQQQGRKKEVGGSRRGQLFDLLLLDLKKYFLQVVGSEGGDPIIRGKRR